ncbi:MAG: hypothetical protein M1834_007390 [Cirrosporium novae-zelandiae]|nr:MAG: hypothetical protein M1834_007390 [Cirrosporium novae-zelandiae]
MSVWILLFALLQLAAAYLQANETKSYISVTTEKLRFKVSKTNGDLYDAFYEDTDLLGTRSSSTGRGYLICYCTSSDVKTSAGEHSVGNANTTDYTLIDDYDDTNTHYVGIKMDETLPTGQTFEYWWFVRDDGEPALHSWTRMTYNNASVPYLTTFGEYRYLFRSGTEVGWTHLSVNGHIDTPVPSAGDLASEIQVQDNAWIFPNSTSDYSKAVGSYFSKYIFADNFDNPHKAHGLYKEASANNGTSIGAWQLASNLTPIYPGIALTLYNKWSTSHYGARYSNITDGFDRTFGPQALYFNGGKNKTLAELKADAYSRANEEWESDFYDYIGKKHVPTYIRSSQRSKVLGQVNIPNGTVKSQAILAQNGVDYSDNVADQSAHQHWVDVDLDTGKFEIDRVAAGTYRLTITFFGHFGDFHLDNVTILANQTKELYGLKYKEDSHGEELWRIGIPDRTSGEFKHGYETDTNHTSHLEQYRQVWQAYDFPTDFPNGVTFRPGTSNELTDWNSIHWSTFGPTYDHQYTVYTNINNFTILFNLSSAPSSTSTYTFTIALAGAHGSSAPFSFNTTNVSLDWTLADVHLLTYINDSPAYDWYIWQGYASSLGMRSGVSGYNLKTYWRWNGTLFKEGENKIVLSLPQNASSYAYVQYDALRLEVSGNGTEGNSTLRV